MIHAKIKISITHKKPKKQISIIKSKQKQLDQYFGIINDKLIERISFTQQLLLHGDLQDISYSYVNLPFMFI